MPTKPTKHDDPLLERRGFLRLGGATIAMAAVFAAAACGNGDNDATSDNEGDDEGAKGDERDVTILRTSASVALAAVDFYQRALDSGLLTTTSTADAAKAFPANHREHADLFNGAAKAAGGEAATQPNAVVAQALQGPLGQAKDEPAVLAYALQMENTALATHLASVGRFQDAGLNRTTMSAGGVAARHAAVLAGLLRQPPAAKASFIADGAVAPGSGL